MGVGMKKKVLVVDDEPGIVKIVELELKFYGYEVITASSGKEGLEKCKRMKPDAVIMDIMMPGMGGNQAAEELKSDPSTSHIPIIFLTGMVTTAEVPKDLVMGDQYLLAKPFKCEQLLSMLRKVLPQ
jgi:CheY-like chemotaxis protein